MRYEVKRAPSLVLLAIFGVLTLSAPQSNTARIDAALQKFWLADTLLLSPERFDFAKPVTVVVNGRKAFEGRVERNLKTLLKWAAIDNDRTMLYGAELKVRVPNGR